MNHVVKADESLVLGWNPELDLVFFVSMEESWVAHLVQNLERPTIYFLATLSQDV